LQKQLKWAFDKYEVLLAENREQAVEILKTLKPPVVTLDLGLPPDTANATEGLAALKELLEIAPDTKVIVVTGNDEHENALQSIYLGAYDFYQKPIEPEILGLIIERAYKLYSLEQENRRLNEERGATSLTGIVASSKIMLDVCNTISKVAPTDASVLLLGESGTGKELLARSLHELGLRKKGPFIAINCAAIPENLLESELFGYEKGSFTGAAKQTRGKIEYADGGTLFLDEVGDLSQSLQAKLLRFLQERTIERIGGREEISVDVRIVCATHKNLEEQIETGEFREDLYYRISEISISIPPLRDRPGDAVLLSQHFLNLYKTPQTRAKKFGKNAITAIENYKWQGNARELENKIKRAIILADSEFINESDLDLPLDKNISHDEKNLDLKFVREVAEKEAIKNALDRTGGKVSAAAKLLGVSRPTLYDLLDKHSLK
jgi:two-component system NtrC family response regulator